MRAGIRDRLAYRMGRTGAASLMVVAISEEMQRETAAVPDIGPARVLPPHPAPEAVPAMMDMLRKARKPLAVLGGGGWSAEGRAAIRGFLLANDLPVAVSFRRQGLFDGASPNFVGDLGVGADAALVAKAKDCDLFVAIGTRMGEPVSQGYTLLDMAGATPIVHVHHDQAEPLERNALGEDGVRPDDDVDAGGERLQLGLVSHAAVDGQHPEAAVGAGQGEVGGDLQGELARRLDTLESEVHRS